MKNVVSIQSKKYSPEYLLSFYNYTQETIQNDIWFELQNGLWKEFNIDNFLFNNSLPSEQIHTNLPVFNGFHQIVAGTYWDDRTKHLQSCKYTPKRIPKCSIADLIDVTGEYIESLDAKRIGVHLSGGFDSSLIMAILKELDIPFVPIGLKSDTFEFRTERQVQDIMLEWGDDGLLIDIEQYPHFSDLDKIGIHQVPDCDIKSVGAARAVASAFAEKGCDIVFTGLGGDSLFVDAIPNVENLCFNIEYEFLNPTETERIYLPKNIKLKSFYAHSEIINIICSAREGQSSDFLKRWGRKWTESILPPELTRYNYCADFFGLSMWGLERSKPTIKRLLEESYDITKHKIFSNENRNKFLNQDVYSFEYKDYIQFCSLISISSWYHSLFNNG